jgi:hypothetical protein
LWRIITITTTLYSNAAAPVRLYLLLGSSIPVST